MVRAVLARDPLVLGWAKRIYIGLGRGKKNEIDFLFDVARGQKDIFVLQVGANDGIRDDAVGPFIRRCRWRGLLLEPLPDIFGELRNTYRGNDRVSLVNAALADRDGEMTLYRVQRVPGVPENCHGLGSFYRDIVMRHSGAFAEFERHIAEETIKAVSFSTLVREQNVEKIDVMVIDTEGYDFEVLKLIDFQQFRPELVLYEHVHLSNEDREAASQFLARLGYEVHQIKKGDRNTAAIYRGAWRES
jgi:FkbM family methyltransferase